MTPRAASDIVPVHVLKRMASASPAPVKPAPHRPEDWILAGFARLAREGVDSVRVEVLCRDLGVSKGSFYWHFRDREELLAAMIAQWENEEAAWVSAAALSNESAASRWARLVEHCADSERGKLEAGLRSWARRENRVAVKLAAIERDRTAYIARIMRDVGFTARAAEKWSHVAMLVCLGWADRATRDSEFAAGRGLGEFLSDLLLAASGQPRAIQS